MDSIPQQLLLQVILILINAFFAMTEIAVISLNPGKLRMLAEEGDKTAPRLLKLVEEPAGFLSTIQIAITLAGFLSSAFAADSFAGYLVDWVYTDLGFQSLSRGTLNTLSVIVITLILSYFTLVLGELTPKRIAMQKPLQVAKLSCGVVMAVAAAARPAVWLLSASTNGLLKLLRLSTQPEEESVTEEEIRMMVDLGQAKGTIQREEGEWIDNVFDFGESMARDLMTHAGDVTAFPATAEDGEILQAIRKTGLSRYPVYDGDLNHVLGILNARVFLLDRAGDHPRPLRELLRTAYFVPDTLNAATLLRDMQSKKVHIAVVIDEYGDTAGIITMEDLLEEIVGNIYDEFDKAEQPRRAGGDRGRLPRRLEGQRRRRHRGGGGDPGRGPAGGPGVRHPGRAGVQPAPHHPPGRPGAGCGGLRAPRPRGPGGRLPHRQRHGPQVRLPAGECRSDLLKGPFSLCQPPVDKIPTAVACQAPVFSV